MAKKLPDDHIGLGWIARESLELLKRHPQGLSVHELRAQIANPGAQQHFDRRIRNIRKQYVLEIRREGRDQFYVLGPRLENPLISKPVPEKMRAAVIHAAHGRCQMCGKTIEHDGIKLQADHKIPQSWGGTNERENLWALCEECNRGKRNFFKSLPDDEMTEILGFDSVHERIANFLRIHIGEPVPDYMIETIANIKDQQHEWRKRLRELRYPVIGLNIEMRRRRGAGGATQVDYILKNWKELPEDHKALIRQHEQKTKKIKRQFSPDE